MKGISKYNNSGCYDPTAYSALTNVLREQRKAAKATMLRKRRKAGSNRQEVRNGQKP